MSEPRIDVLCEVCGYSGSLGWLVKCQNSNRCGSGRHLYCLNGLEQQNAPVDLSALGQLECSLCVQSATQTAGKGTKRNIISCGSSRRRKLGPGRQQPQEQEQPPQQPQQQPQEEQQPADTTTTTTTSGATGEEALAADFSFVDAAVTAAGAAEAGGRSAAGDNAAASASNPAASEAATDATSTQQDGRPPKRARKEALAQVVPPTSTQQASGPSTMDTTVAADDDRQTAQPADSLAHQFPTGQPQQQRQDLPLFKRRVLASSQSQAPGDPKKPTAATATTEEPADQPSKPSRNNSALHIAKGPEAALAASAAAAASGLRALDECDAFDDLASTPPQQRKLHKGAAPAAVPAAAAAEAGGHQALKGDGAQGSAMSGRAGLLPLAMRGSNGTARTPAAGNDRPAAGLAAAPATGRLAQHAVTRGHAVTGLIPSSTNNNNNMIAGTTAGAAGLASGSQQPQQQQGRMGAVAAGGRGLLLGLGPRGAAASGLPGRSAPWLSVTDKTLSGGLPAASAALLGSSSSLQAAAGEAARKGGPSSGTMQQAELWSARFPVRNILSTSKLQNLVLAVLSANPHDSMRSLLAQLPSLKEAAHDSLAWELVPGNEVPGAIREAKEFYTQYQACETCLVVKPKFTIGESAPMFRRLLGEIRERSSILSVTLPPQLFHDRLRHLPAMERLLSSSLVAPSLPGTASDKGANATAGNSSNCNDNSSSRQGGPYRLYFTPHQDPSTGDDAASGAEDCLLCLTGSRKHISLVAAWDRASAQDKGVKGILRREARQVKLRVHFDTTVTQEPVVPSHPHGSMQKKGKEPHRKEVQETNARLLLGCKVEVDEEDETAAAAVAVAPEASAVPERGMMDGAASSSGGTAAAGGQPGGGGGGGGECDGGGDCGKQQLEAAGAGKATSQGDALVASAADDEHKGAALVAAGAGDTNQGATAAAAVAAGGLPGADVAPASDAAGTGTRVEEALSAAAAAAAITAEAPAAHTHMLLDDNPVLLGCVDEAMQEAVSAATPVIVTTLPGQQGIGFSCHAGLAGHSRGGGAGGSAPCRSMLTVVEAEGGAEGATATGRMRMTWAIEYAAAAAAMPPRGAAGVRVPAAVAADAASAGGGAALNASAAAGGAAVNAAGATAAGPEGGRGGDQEREEEEQEKEDALLLFRRRISASSDMSLVETEYPSDSSSDDSSSSDDTGVGAGRNGDSSIAAFDSYRSSLAGNLGMAAAGAEWGQHGFLPPRPSVAAGAGTLTGNLLNWCNSAVQQELTAGWCRPQGLAKWLTPKENDVPRPPAAAAAAAPAVAPAPQGSNLQPAAVVAAVCTTAAPAAEASSRQPNTCAPAVTAVADGRQLWSWRDLLPIYDIPRQQPLPPAGRNGGQTATAAPAVQHSAVAAANKTAAADAAVGAPDAAVGSGSSAAHEAAAAAAAAHVGNAHTGSSCSGGSNRSGSVARVPQAGWSWGKVALPVLQAAVSQDLPSSCAPLCQELRVGLPQLWRDLKVLSRLPLRGCRLLLLASDPESAELQGPLQEAAEVLGLAWSRGHPDQPPEQLRSMQLLALGKSVEEGVAEMRGVILKSIAVHPIEIFSAPVLVHGLQLLAWEVRNRSAAATAGAGALSHGGMGSEAAAGAAGAATGAAAVELTLGRAMCLAAAAAATAVPRDCLPLYPHRVVVVVAAQGFMETDPAVLDRLFGCMTAGAITWGEPWPLHMRAADIAAVLTRGSPQHRAAILRATTPGMCVPATGAASSRAVHSVAGKGAVMGAPLLSALSINAESTSQTELQVLSDANKFMCLMRPGRLVVAAYGEGQAERLGKPGRMCKNILCGTVREVVAFLELLLQDVSRC